KFSTNTVSNYFALSSQSVTTVENNGNVPSKFALEQNYPNPFNPATTIKYSIPVSEFVRVKIYDVLGKEIATLVNREQAAGSYKVEFDGSRLASGIYLFKLQTNNFVETKKMVLTK
ncbi:MAG: T9SS type A sorting domain-containing protein, partial [Ignavibacteria bacterium]